ncbi:helix-turn-helix transcriptional regulator [Deinococcus sp. Arct2-2]|uniref:helix-turn-helix domain-containing protein n=1 Tax=Deinococcus sp. Arct2-2 TaxID=2568653 RepID=UPI0010A482B7|nr:helix-turn-helix transcriptional regulator [Deinococcus sp. Arct2-2]THF69839.1 helix-turn-helix transcriptional regulator [Deinococcus sp. Arct2-2]
MSALSHPAKDPYLVALGAQIRQLRQAQGWSQDEFAARAGMHRTHPTKLENGLLDPRLSTLRRVAEVLGVEVSVLLPVKE